MAESTQITYERVRSDANTIKGCATTMKNIFEEFNASMKRVGSSDVFVGKGQESLNERYTSLKSKFDEYVKLVESFANMILSAADDTERTERAIAEDASHLAG